MATVRGRSFAAALGGAAILLTIWAAGTPRPSRVSTLPPVGRQLTGRRALDEQIPRGVDLDLEAFTSPDRSTSDLLGALLGWGTLLALLLIGGAAGVLVVRALLDAWRERRRPPPADDALLPDLDAVALAVAEDFEGRIGALAAGTPAEGIIAAWVRLETTLHDVGLPLAPSRTSTEVSLDVLRQFTVDEGALGDLAALYREARFSRHPLGEDDRARAEAAHRTIDADLRRSAPTATGGRRG